jgi:hypothetical protein
MFRAARKNIVCEMLKGAKSRTKEKEEQLFYATTISILGIH